MIESEISQAPELSDSDDADVFHRSELDANEGGPLANVVKRFSVRSVLTGSFFVPLSTDHSQIAEEAKSSNSITVLCLKCVPDAIQKKKEVKASLFNNSNLIAHLSRNHVQATVTAFKNSLDEARTAFVNSNPNRRHETRVPKISASYNDTRKVEFDQLMVDFVIQAMVPLQTVAQPSFRKIFDFLRIEKSGLKVMSRRTLARRLDERFTAHIAHLQDLISPIQWVCTTADIWSGGKRSFMGVTAHWIDGNLERKSVALACKRFRGSHTHDKIASILEDIHNNFQLSVSPIKVVATVTDNGSNFVKAFKEFQVQEQFGEADEDEREDNASLLDMEDDAWLPLQDDVVALLPQHLRCGAHTLALTAGTDILKAIKTNAVLWPLHSEAMEKCNTLWRLCNRPKSAEVIQEFVKKCLRTPTPTRWNSLYDSLNEIVNIKDKVEELWEKLQLHNPFREEELLYLEEYVKCAKPVANAIDILQGERNAYYGSFVPTILALEKQLQKLLHSNSYLVYCHPVVEAYLSSIKHRFAEFISLDTLHGQNAAIAALSFPKFKKAWFSRVTAITQENLLHRFQTLIHDELTSESRGDRNEPMDTEPPLEDFYDFGEEDDEPILPTPSSLDLKAKSIMEQYFADETRGVEMLHKYSQVKSIFLKYNTPLPSSAQVERLFSYATMTNTPKSNRLSDEKFEKRVILKANFGN